jgi:hypothetical protein
MKGEMLERRYFDVAKVLPQISVIDRRKSSALVLVLME